MFKQTNLPDIFPGAFPPPRRQYYNFHGRLLIKSKIWGSPRRLCKINEKRGTVTRFPYETPRNIDNVLLRGVRKQMATLPIECWRKKHKIRKLPGSLENSARRGARAVFNVRYCKNSTYKQTNKNDRAISTDHSVIFRLVYQQIYKSVRLRWFSVDLQRCSSRFVAILT